MGVLDKVVAAITPEASDEERMQKRAQARQLAGRSGWLAQVLDHHEERLHRGAAPGGRQSGWSDGS